ncbi:DUF4011 domain-containing anti-phage protein Hhe [Kiloniella sp.]|uniref:DUF4011 domain-containing anti-phage protein Hhe n=1 Tax=Kiloniella sp. TaxID=1938587 RepID=UPI003A93C9F7
MVNNNTDKKTASSSIDESGASIQQTSLKNEFAYSSLETLRKKLLDLTARNSLLNYKHPKVGCIRLIDELPDQIISVLQSGKALTFIPVPEPTENQLIEAGYITIDPITQLKTSTSYPTAEKWAKNLGYDTSFDLPDKEAASEGEDKHNDTFIQSLLYAPDLEARLRSLRSKSEIAIEENGSNILYLTVGFLEFYENRGSDQKRLAPLFTLPVKLDRTKFDKGAGTFRYSITAKDDGLLTNVTLLEKLANDFGLILPFIEEDTLPEDYFEQISSTILRQQPRWSIRRQATLALLNFTKQAMYQDLSPDNWPSGAKIEDHPIIKQFFTSTEDERENNSPSYEVEHSIDSIDEVHEAYPLIDDADSSQHSALIDAIDGENLVIEGPPGSGKSQTITNLIAASIANGKRVLFVAEKMAALNVVKSRLDRAGLGDFCLELHSHKTNKQKILNDLHLRINNQENYRSPSDIKVNIERYEALKSQLLKYVELINNHWRATNLSLHQILNKATRYREHLSINPDKLKIDGIDGQSLTPVKQQELCDSADMLRSIYDQVSQQTENGIISNHYWYGVTNCDLIGFQADDLNEKLLKWTNSLETLQSDWKGLLDDLNLDAPENPQFQLIEDVVSCAEKLPDLEGDEPLEALPILIESSNQFELLLSEYQSIHEEGKSLSKTIKAGKITDKETFEIISKCLKAMDALGCKKEMPLNDLISLQKTMEISGNEAKEIAKQFSQIIPSIPEDMKVSFKVSQYGLREFTTLISLIDKLPSDLWQHRNELYDNPDLDPLLDKVSKKLGQLTPIHKSLLEIFSLHRLPRTLDLEQIQLTLDNAGIFRWFSSEWRRARKSLIKLSVTTKPKTKQLIQSLPELIQYSHGIDDLERLNNDDPSLQDLYKGVETPIKRIEMLRHWYRLVRNEYGIGFGDRVKLGTALLSIDRNLVIGILDTANQGLSEMANDVLTSTNNYRDQFKLFSPLKDLDTHLDVAIPILSTKVSEVLINLENFCVDGSHSIGELGYACKRLGTLQTKSTEWQSTAIKKKLVPSLFNFSLSPGEFSNDLVASAKNTLEVAKILIEVPSLKTVFTSSADHNQYKALKAQLKTIDELIKSINRDEIAFSEIGHINMDEWTEHSDGSLQFLLTRNKYALEKPLWLPTWLEYIRLKNKLSSQGLDRIINNLVTDSISTKDLNEIVQLVMYHQLANEVLEEHPTLSQFSGMEQMAVREKFQEYDKKLKELQREKVAHKASRKNPSTGVSSGKVGNYTELSLIRHNIGLKKPRIAVRSLIRRASQSLQALKPCFMMSPMSVAQYLEPGKFNFDLVVMDEASQIRPEDALGAIARGTNLVVVGDPKQLPPTSFFQKTLNNDEGEDSVALEESESILESVIPMFVNRRLRWHYRSRHESLIAFSNQNFYDSNLILFPSPFQKSDELGIRFSKVSKGRFINRKNTEEAREVARSAALHLLDNPKESIGIVAMSSDQRDEIERQIDQYVKDDELLRLAYDKNQQTDEPLFIKNLENVQGDERDVIVISMTYGPETAGSASMFQRFGPINSPMGWRRLNVLFTRSKKRMHIHSSMDSGHIRVSETSSRGLKALKAFIEYCEVGHLHHANITGKAPDSDFEISVMRALADRGYDCEPQLGVAGYFLDLAVKDPGMPGRFLMGIECDGASYHSAKSTRDRDRLRQEILENLGWTIRRIWSTDWFKNPQAQLQPIFKELDRLKTPISQDQPIPTSVIEASNSISDDDDSALIEDDLSPSIPKSLRIEQEATLQDIADDKLLTRLKKFDTKIIRTELPNTPIDKQLLRPAMLDALLEHLPGSKAEFLEFIPAYLRTGTSPEESKYLERVLELISEYG